jgi:hypothetical protein
MLADPLSLNSATAITAGTSDAQSYGLQSISGVGSVRSVASLSQSAPRTVKIVRSTRTKRFSGNVQVAGTAVKTPVDVVTDVVSIRNDVYRAHSSAADPNFDITSWVQIQFGSPRGCSMTVTQMSDQLLALVSMLNASTNANLTKVLNGEP